VGAPAGRERCAVLTSETVRILDPWLRERNGEPHEPLFPTRRGGPLTPRAFAVLLDKHTATATRARPSLQTKRVTPHTLRHTAAGRQGRAFGPRLAARP
jgi:integrase